jgi:hypothetical protein
LIPLLDKLDKFMNNDWLSSTRLSSSSSRSASQIQHHFASALLKEAQAIAKFVKHQAPVLNNITFAATRQDASSGNRLGPAAAAGFDATYRGMEDEMIAESTSEVVDAVATSLANRFLEESSWDNISKQLRADWVDAVIHGSDFDVSGTILGSKLCSGEYMHTPSKFVLVSLRVLPILS